MNRYVLHKLLGLFSLPQLYRCPITRYTDRQLIMVSKHALEVTFQHNMSVLYNNYLHPATPNWWGPFSYTVCRYGRWTLTLLTLYLTCPTVSQPYLVVSFSTDYFKQSFYWIKSGWIQKKKKLCINNFIQKLVTSVDNIFCHSENCDCNITNRTKH